MALYGKAAKAVDATTESTAVEEIELVIAEANMQYYLDDTVTNETLAQYLAKKFSPYETGSGAEITFSADGSIQYEGKNGEIIMLAMEDNGKVEITKKADGTKIQRTVAYNANGGTGNLPTTQNFDRKAMVNVDFSTLPTREGYNFLGWASNSSAESPEYTQSGTKSFTIGSGNVTLYAVWDPIQSYHAQHPELHIPTGFSHTTGTVSDGYVIADSEGNEFVWIPVASSADYQKKLGTKNYYAIQKSAESDETATDLENDVKKVVQGDILGTNTILGKSVSGTLASYPEAAIVNRAGGFWVGRYEAGIASAERTDYIAGIKDESTSDYDASNNYWTGKQVIVKKGAEPVRTITQAKSLELANNWKKGSTDTSKGTVSFQSGLITGTQWDIMCNFIGWITCDTDCSSWGNYANAIATSYTGYHSNDISSDWINSENVEKLGDDTNRWIFPTGEFVNSANNNTAKKNIYDVAGNVWEWTTKVSANNSNIRITRGGSGKDSSNTGYVPTYRHSYHTATTEVFSNAGFRIVLYVE